MNADLLADMIMKDMVEDAALEIQGVQDDRKFSNDAMAMQDAPSLETMVQKLELMEVINQSCHHNQAVLIKPFLHLLKNK